MQSKLANPIILSDDALAVLRKARDAWAMPTKRTGVWAVTTDAEMAAVEALVEAGLIIELYSFSAGAMTVCLTGDGLNTLTSYEAALRTLAQEAAR